MDREEYLAVDNPKVIGAPEAIWLCYGPLTRDLTHPKYVSQYEDEITWHERAIDSSDVKYMRADIANELLDMLKLCRYHIEHSTPMMDHTMRNSLLMDRDRVIAKAEGVLDDCD